MVEIRACEKVQIYETASNQLEEINGGATKYQFKARTVRR